MSCSMQALNREPSITKGRRSSSQRAATSGKPQPRKTTGRAHGQDDVQAPHPLARLLVRLARNIPDYEAPLLECAQAVEEIATCNDEVKMSRILAAVDDGCNALADIIEETKLNDDEVRDLVLEMVRIGILEDRAAGVRIESARGTVKKQRAYYRSGSPAFSPLFQPERHQPLNIISSGRAPAARQLSDMHEIPSGSKSKLHISPQKSRPKGKT
jgi:hypothetical protein